MIFQHDFSYVKLNVKPLLFSSPLLKDAFKVGKISVFVYKGAYKGKKHLKASNQKTETTFVY